jgi:hypothetical protein
MIKRKEGSLLSRLNVQVTAVGAYPGEAGYFTSTYINKYINKSLV